MSWKSGAFSIYPTRCLTTCLLVYTTNVECTASVHLRFSMSFSWGHYKRLLEIVFSFIQGPSMIACAAVERACAPWSAYTPKRLRRATNQLLLWSIFIVSHMRYQDVSVFLYLCCEVRWLCQSSIPGPGLSQQEREELKEENRRERTQVYPSCMQ